MKIGGDLLLSPSSEVYMFSVFFFFIALSLSFYMTMKIGGDLAFTLWNFNNPPFVFCIPFPLVSMLIHYDSVTDSILFVLFTVIMILKETKILLRTKNLAFTSWNLDNPPFVFCIPFLLLSMLIHYNSVTASIPFILFTVIMILKETKNTITNKKMKIQSQKNVCLHQFILQGLNN